MRSILAVFVIAAFYIIPGNVSSAADHEWAKLKVGQVAYLAAQLESDNDPNTRPVCRSKAELIALYHFQVNDCSHRRWGQIVVVTAIEPGFDDDKTSAFSKTIPFVGIRSRDSRWTGWVQAVSLEPLIPVGTRLLMKQSGNAIPSIYLTKDVAIGADVSLGTPVTVEVIRQDPPIDGNCSLLVKALTGPKAGTSGWTCDDGEIEGTKLEADYLN